MRACSSARASVNARLLASVAKARAHLTFPPDCMNSRSLITEVDEKAQQLAHPPMCDYDCDYDGDDGAQTARQDSKVARQKRLAPIDTIVAQWNEITMITKNY